MGALFFFIYLCLAIPVTGIILATICYIYDKKNGKTKLHYIQYLYRWCK